MPGRFRTVRSAASAGGWLTTAALCGKHLYVFARGHREIWQARLPELARGRKDLEALSDQLKTAQDDAKGLDQARHSLQEEVARAEGPTRQTAEEVQELENKLVLARARREGLEAEITETRNSLSQEEAVAHELEAENVRLAETRDLVARTNERMHAEAERTLATSDNGKAKKLAAQLIEALQSG